jgi:hypothetical protein
MPATNHQSVNSFLTLKEVNMQTMRRMVQEHYYNLMLLLLAGGFAMLLAELLILEHTDGIQLVGVAASVIGLILVLAALFVHGRAATMLAAALVVLSATGLVGTYQHLANREGESAKIQRQQEYQAVAYFEDNEESTGEAESESPPPLAPLSLAGLSIVAAATMVGAPRKEEA